MKMTSQWAFKDACYELKSKGLGHVKSFNKIDRKGKWLYLYQMFFFLP